MFLVCTCANMELFLPLMLAHVLTRNFVYQGVTFHTFQNQAFFHIYNKTLASLLLFIS